jgi:predicted N-acetyltransferase YhbS
VLLPDCAPEPLDAGMAARQSLLSILEVDMTKTFALSPSLPSDQTTIERLLDLCFGPQRRTKTSYRLREGNTAVEGLSLLVRDAEVGIAGAISYWPLAIGAKGTRALLLGPLAVHPMRQNIGIGRFLMNETLAKAESSGHKLVILVGDAPYYARVGFAQVPEGQLLLPGPTDPKRLLFLELSDGALAEARGLVVAAHRYVG